MENGDLINTFKGFKLIRLKLISFSFFGTINYSFIDEDDKQDKIYTTLIIGPNGTLKSLLFNLIVYIFKTIDDIIKNNEIDYKKYPEGDFHLTYSLNNVICKIIRSCSINNKGYKSYKYDLRINSKMVLTHDFIMPSNIIGNSINITDKFPFYKIDEFPTFKYLGLKYNPQLTLTQF